ncbi:MAG: hypothetical protein KBD58_07745, partial [Thermomonas sp.]|nr:hypothetical protein [Thermomonas sp.]
MRRRWLLALAVLLAAPVQAQVADCDGAASSPLQPSPHAAADARAYWLDATTIRWPKMPANARYRLHASATAGLRVERGAAVEGADAAVPLQPATASAA